MLAWSDWDPARGPALPRSAALRHLVTELSAPGQEVLVAGPHDDDFVTGLLAAGSRVTWLCRSLSDALPGPGRDEIVGRACSAPPARWSSCRTTPSASTTG